MLKWTSESQWIIYLMISILMCWSKCSQYTLNTVKSTSIISLTLQYPSYHREHMFVVQISLLIVTILSLISWFLSLMQATKQVNPHPRIAPYVNMWSVTFMFLFFFFLCHLLNVGARICHIPRQGQVKWTTPTQVRRERIQIPWCHMLHFLYSVKHPC